jgi:hypothetical protein
MLKLLCLLLAIPGFALADQDGGPHSVAARTVSALPVALRPMAPRTGLSRIPAADPAALCEMAVASAELSGRLPARLLHAISLTESGRADAKAGIVRAWPWTINAEGEGRFFDTKQQAVAAVRALQARGVQSIDVGCMQVNLMYHPHAFITLESAFDPQSNAAYAARFLNALHADGRDWPRAIAAYHSETPALGEAYRVLVMARWEKPDLRDIKQPQAAYQNFINAARVYGAFTHAGRVYGAFEAKQ